MSWGCQRFFFDCLLFHFFKAQHLLETIVRLAAWRLHHKDIFFFIVNIYFSFFLFFALPSSESSNVKLGCKSSFCKPQQRKYVEMQFKTSKSDTSAFILWNGFCLCLTIRQFCLNQCWPLTHSISQVVIMPCMIGAFTFFYCHDLHQTPKGLYYWNQNC